MIRSSSVTAVAATLAAGLSTPQPVLAQDGGDQRFGTVHFATTCNDTAQRRFDRGMRYQHSFWYAQAKEIFEDAAKADPECAMPFGAPPPPPPNNPPGPPPTPTLPLGLAAIQK